MHFLLNLFCYLRLYSLHRTVSINGAGQKVPQLWEGLETASSQNDNLIL